MGDTGEGKVGVKSRILLIALVIGVFFGVFTLQRACSGNEAEEEEELLLAWEQSDITISAGEMWELKWMQNREAVVGVEAEGEAISIIRKEKGKVQIRGVTGGVGILRVFGEDVEAVCVVTVRGERFGFAVSSAAIGVGEDVEFDMVADPWDALERGEVVYRSRDGGVAEIVETSNYLVKVRGIERGVVVIDAEWNGKSAQLELTVLAGSNRKILVPYRKQYVYVGQEAVVKVQMENGTEEEDGAFRFEREPGKNFISLKSYRNTVTVTGVAVGVQYMRVRNPGAAESVTIVFDVIPSEPPSPPSIDVSESPMMLRKDETRTLRMFIANPEKGEQGTFSYRIVENEYAVEIVQRGSNLVVKGIAPGAAKVRIENSIIYRDYDVMIIVDD